MNTELFEQMQDLSGIVMILLRTGLLCLVWRLFLPKEADKRVRFIVLAALLAAGNDGYILIILQDSSRCGLGHRDYSAFGICPWRL